jgi:hypothetical protein
MAQRQLVERHFVFSVHLILERSIFFVFYVLEIYSLGNEVNGKVSFRSA